MNNLFLNVASNKHYKKTRDLLLLLKNQNNKITSLPYNVYFFNVFCCLFFNEIFKTILFNHKHTETLFNSYL